MGELGRLASSPTVEARKRRRIEAVGATTNQPTLKNFFFSYFIWLLEPIGMRYCY